MTEQNKIQNKGKMPALFGAVASLGVVGFVGNLLGGEILTSIASAAIGIFGIGRIHKYGQNLNNNELADNEKGVGFLESFTSAFDMFKGLIDGKERAETWRNLQAGISGGRWGGATI